MPRAFVAVTLPLAVRSTLVACRQSFIEADPQWHGEKWVAEENLHITLRFLGIVPDALIPHVDEAVREAVADREPYHLRLDGVRAIPRPRSASLVWIQPSTGGEEAAALAGAIADATSFLEFEPEGHRFRTHVTLCRARHPRRVITPSLDAVEHILRRSEDRAVAMSVREVTLFSSTLTPRGPVYEELAIIPLGR
ncbi:MAG: RNA 2',3'-cyclic phosphodiesterase [Coriobacteriia bacterium]